MTGDLRARIRAAISATATLRGLDGPERTELATVPLDAATDAVMAVLGLLDERMVRDKVAAEIRAYAAGLHSASEPTWYGGMADAAQLASGVDPQELHRRNAEAVKTRRGWT